MNEAPNSTTREEARKTLEDEVSRYFETTDPVHLRQALRTMANRIESLEETVAVLAGLPITK